MKKQHPSEEAKFGFLKEPRPFGISNIIKASGAMVAPTFKPRKEDCNMKYIGVDAHSSNCVFSVMGGKGAEMDKDSGKKMCFCRKG